MTYAVPASHKGFAARIEGPYAGEDPSYRGQPEFSPRVYREVAEAFGLNRDEMRNLDVPERRLSAAWCKDSEFVRFAWGGKWKGRGGQDHHTLRQILTWWAQYLRT